MGQLRRLEPCGFCGICWYIVGSIRSACGYSHSYVVLNCWAKSGAHGARWEKGGGPAWLRSVILVSRAWDEVWLR